MTGGNSGIGRDLCAAYSFELEGAVQPWPLHMWKVWKLKKDKGDTLQMLREAN